MCGSLVKFPAPGVITDDQNASVSASRIPSATPVALEYDLTRPLTIAMNCVGPTSPWVSGGYAGASSRLGPSKLSGDSSDPAGAGLGVTPPSAVRGDPGLVRLCS